MDITVRRAEAKDIDKVSKLLSEVLEIHAKLRSDIFISGTTKYTKEEFDNLSYICSYLDGKMIKPKTDENEETTYCFKESESNRALYQAPTSVATISIKDNTISTHVTAEHQQITISTQTSGYNEQGWKNSSFLVQLPSEIILG